VLRIRSTTFGVVLAACLLLAEGGQAQSPPAVVGPYDGRIPFRCELQNVGTGTEFPDPGADPFCVEFDKTNQNVTDFGLVEFTSQEPTRVAAAATKCFYFQRDHWTGSVVQGTEPELWHWDGDYYFDRARGVGGVSVRNYRIGGTPQSASPFVPEAYRPYFDEDGGGGVEVLLESGPDPSCAAKVDTPEERDRVYGERGLYPECIEPGGRLRGKRVGRVKLAMKRDRARAKLGPPEDHGHGIDRWCLVGKGELRIAYDERERAGAILTSGRGHSLHGVSRGDRAQRAHRLLALRRSRKIGGVTVFVVRPHGGTVQLVGIESGRVRWVLIDNASVGRKTFLRLARDVG
jgi:hypothetical protein